MLPVDLQKIKESTVDLRDIHKQAKTKEPFETWSKLVIGCLGLREGKDFVRLPFAAGKN